MAEIHKLLQEHGKAGVLALDVDRRVVEAAAGYLGSEEGEVGFLYSGWAQSALPHKKLADDMSWQVHTDHVSLVVQPGLRPCLTGEAVSVGVPYGSRARLIILYLQSEALKTQSREVELGKTLHAWLRRLEIPIGGKSMAAVRDQAERISRCRMSFQIKQGNRTGLVNQGIDTEKPPTICERMGGVLPVGAFFEPPVAHAARRHRGQAAACRSEAENWKHSKIGRCGSFCCVGKHPDVFLSGRPLVRPRSLREAARWVHRARL
jgi:hypothetical protein